MTVFISATELFSPYVDSVSRVWRDYLGYNVIYTPVKESPNGIPLENYAKVSRVINTFNFPDELCLISDADIIPMNKDYFYLCASKVTNDNIVFYTSELTGEDKGKYPICYMLATGRTFQRLVNPEMLSIPDLLKSWSDFEDVYENVSSLPFSDESLYRRIFPKDIKKVCIDRHHQHRRLCRSNWIIDDEKLKSGYYIDCHLPRPFNMESIKPVFESLNISL